MTYPIFPVSGDAIKCGKRKDVPRDMRRHLFAYLGYDTRTLNGFKDVTVWACVRCGQDETSLEKKKPRYAKLLALFEERESRNV